MKTVKTIIAIGGGELKDLETLPIDRTIIQLSRKKSPRVLFIPTASNDSFGYWETFQAVYGKKLGCKTDVLFLVREKLAYEEIEKKILAADIVYVGGGNTLRMLRIWRKYGVDLLLRRAYEKGIILSGLSAGAICWFLYGSSDSRSFMKNGKPSSALMRLRGLGFLPFTLSPHHIREKRLRDPGIQEIMQRTPGIALALDDCSAMCFRGDEYEVLTARRGVGVRKVFSKKGKIEVYAVASKGLISDLAHK
ncbi:MAG: Type 1 glutamine amidotransferase-like domain-containing protein [Candidatus Moranbacteria bacterium]|nr:Type 1 glutamine amidotransferase-like domain-containing protein [Candidatus Moranbacteria bacterium]